MNDGGGTPVPTGLRHQLNVAVVGGNQLVVQLQRAMEAERLYRITGQGRYRESALLGLPTPVPADELPGLVMGQDTVFAVPYRGRMFWLWGDTTLAWYF